jgi:hypothetical protein
MRLWSLHPKYLDSKGLVALWREGLLARKVLLGKTKGYSHHPQLARFRNQNNPVAAIDSFLAAVCDEAERRGYRFDRSKLSHPGERTTIPITQGQLIFEWHHLLEKLRHRNPAQHDTLKHLDSPEAHPMLMVVSGEVETWEIIKMVRV